MGDIDIINNGTAGGSTADRPSVQDIDAGIRGAAVSYAEWITASQEAGPFNKDFNPVFPLEGLVSAAFVTAIQDRYVFTFMCKKANKVTVTRNDAPAYEDIDSLCKIPRKKDYVIHLSGSRANLAYASQSLPTIFVNSDLTEFVEGLVYEEGRISIVIDEHNWNYVPYILSAFFELAM